MPYAPVMPMAGAPRTASPWMAATSVSTVDSRQYTSWPGSCRWSMMTGAPPSQRTAAMGGRDERPVGEGASSAGCDT